MRTGRKSKTKTFVKHAMWYSMTTIQVLNGYSTWNATGGHTKIVAGAPSASFFVNFVWTMSQKCFLFDTIDLCVRRYDYSLICVLIGIKNAIKFVLKIKKKGSMITMDVEYGFIMAYTVCP